jgi:4-amino-4-deoxy-L-arabinose transferase-like glycosyltransferase
VGILHAAVGRWTGPAAGLIAAAALACTPVATLMFRFNNPDAPRRPSAAKPSTT